MRKRLPPAVAMSRYGLPKNVVRSERPPGMPERVEPWLRARDDFDGLLLDDKDALEAGVISRREFESSKARLSVARRKANAAFERSMRAASQPHPRFHPRRLR